MSSHGSSASSSPPTSPRVVPVRPEPLHRPSNPSRLRHATAASPEDKTSGLQDEAALPRVDEDTPLPQALQPGSGQPITQEPEVLSKDDGEARAEIDEPSNEHVNATTRLLDNYYHTRACGLRDCNHGTFSPSLTRSSSTTTAGGYFNVRHGHAGSLETPHRGHGLFGDSIDTLNAKSNSTSRWLASKYGIKHQTYNYVSYYVPIINWLPQYQWQWFQGDLIAAFTMASFYIPMALSYASNLGHVPPVNGLYAFVFNPLIYAFLGSCPQMVVGPEAAGSLLLGSVVRACIDRGQSGDDDDMLHAEIAGVVTTTAGLVILLAGMCRLGFLDSVLSRPFLRGFISAIGFVILVDQAIPELGLNTAAKQAGADHGSSANKLVFLLTHLKDSHALTALVSLGSFAIIMFFRTLKRWLQPRYPSVAYFPDRFIVVALSAIFTWRFGWDKKGLQVLGNVKTSGGSGIPIHWPYQFHHMQHIDTAFSTAFIIALLGFFESSVAAKSLGEGTTALRGISLSANRELIALGAANVVGGLFMSLPAFGGYGRSKVNASTGGSTPMSSIFLSAITLICVLFVLPYFYYLPKGVLSAMVSVVAYSLIEECPHDIHFFWKIGGWVELSLMLIIFLATMFYSLSVGIAAGIGLSLLSLIKHATKPRIQILGKVPGTTDKFENAEYFPEHIEYVEGCLIVKIPEPLTFANTGQLKSRLKRLEQYGTNAAHPSLPRTRHDEHNKNVIFDVHGVTSIDGSGTQVLTEIVEAYIHRGIRVIFCRLPQKRSKVFQMFEKAGIVDLCGGKQHFVSSVDEALRISDAEDLEQYFDDRTRSRNGQHEDRQN